MGIPGNIHGRPQVWGRQLSDHEGCSCSRTIQAGISSPISVHRAQLLNPSETRFPHL